MEENKIERISDVLRAVNVAFYKKMYPMLANIGLYPNQQLIIMLIYENKEINQSKIAQLTNREPATITKALKRLQQQGYILREVNPIDSRKVRLSLTDKGIDVYKKIVAINEQMNKYVEEALTNEDLNLIIDILLRIKFQLQKEE